MSNHTKCPVLYCICCRLCVFRHTYKCILHLAYTLRTMTNTIIPLWSFMQKLKKRLKEHKVLKNMKVFSRAKHYYIAFWYLSMNQSHTMSCRLCNSSLTTQYIPYMCGLILRPKEEEGPGFSHLCMHLIILDLTMCWLVGGCHNTFKVTWLIVWRRYPPFLASWLLPQRLDECDRVSFFTCHMLL